MLGKIPQSKFVEGLHVTVRGVKLFVKDVYIKGTEKSLTMSDSTAEVRWTTFRLVLLVVGRTGVANHLGIK
jgi:hypothetical protein